MRLFAVESRRKIGYVNARGEWVIKPRFDNGARISREGCVFAHDATGWQLWNQAGEQIKTLLEESEFWLGFSEGLAAIPQAGGLEFIDQNGQTALAGPFERPADRGARFIEGRCALGGRWIDRDGASFGQFVEVRSVYQGCGAFREGDRWGLADLSGLPIVDARYEAVDGFAVCTDGRWGLINEHGESVLECRFEGLGPVRDQRIFALKNGTWQLLDLQGHDLGVRSVGRGSTPVERAQWALTDPDSWIASRPLRPLHGRAGPSHPFNPAPRFSEGLAAVAQNGRWGYIDLDGAWAIEPRFQIAGEFADGYAVVQTGGQWFHLGIDGVTGPAYRHAEPLVMGVARVITTKGKPALVDVSGAVRWRSGWFG